MLVNLLEILENIEKEYGMVGTIVGILVLIISVIAYLSMIIVINRLFINFWSWILGIIIPGCKLI